MGLGLLWGLRVDTALSAKLPFPVCPNRTKRRWRKRPIRSLLCKRPEKKWQKSAPCLPRTSPIAA